jgi:hypothetical protein
MIPLINVSHQRLLIGRLHHPHHADQREYEAEYVREAGERADGVNQRHDPGCHQQHPEDRPQPSPGAIDGGDDELLGGEHQEHQPGEDPDGGDRRPIELQHHDGNHDPEQPEQQLDPPVRRDPSSIDAIGSAGAGPLSGPSKAGPECPSRSACAYRSRAPSRRGRDCDLSRVYDIVISLSLDSLRSPRPESVLGRPVSRRHAFRVIGSTESGLLTRADVPGPSITQIA